MVKVILQDREWHLVTPSTPIMLCGADIIATKMEFLLPKGAIACTDCLNTLIRVMSIR